MPLDLPAGKTTTLNLTLNPITNTLLLSGSSVTNWVSSATQGTPTQTVSNILTLHWPNYLQQGATPDKIVMTITNQTTNVTADYTVASGIGYANKTFTVPFASSALHYPYVVSKVAFYKGSTMLHPKVCTMLLGATIYKSAAATVGIKDHANAELINGIWWATGNLVADGANGCKIGAPTDYGLYFQFGSLVAWRGGTIGDGRGQGWPLVGIAVRPVGYTATPPFLSCPRYITSVAASTSINHILSYPMNVAGVGDPCRHYLGAIWQTPTADMWVSLLGSRGINTTMESAVVRVKNTNMSLPMAGQIREFNGGDWDPRKTTVLVYQSSSAWAAVGYGYAVHFEPNGGWFVPDKGNTPNVLGAIGVRCVSEKP